MSRCTCTASRKRRRKEHKKHKRHEILVPLVFRSHTCYLEESSMKKTLLLFGAVALFAAITFYTQAPQQAPPPAPAAGQRGAPGTENGIAVFQTQCVACHGNPNIERAPSPAALREMSPERIYDALTTGVMKPQ